MVLCFTTKTLQFKTTKDHFDQSEFIIVTFFVYNGTCTGIGLTSKFHSKDIVTVFALKPFPSLHLSSQLKLYQPFFPKVQIKECHFQLLKWSVSQNFVHKPKSIWVWVSAKLRQTHARKKVFYARDDTYKKGKNGRWFGICFLYNLLNKWTSFCFPSYFHLY